MDTKDVREVTIGFRNKGTVIVYFEPFSEPHDEVVIAETRKLAGLISSYGTMDEVSVTCTADGDLSWKGDIEPEEAREAMETLALRAAMSLSLAMAVFSCYPWARYLEKIEEMLDRSLYLHLLKHQERVRIVPTQSVEEVQNATCGIEKTTAGTVLLLPGFPAHLPFGDLVNRRLKEKLLEAMARVFALEPADKQPA